MVSKDEDVEVSKKEVRERGRLTAGAPGRYHLIVIL
jgi:hypothetical protein